MSAEVQVTQADRDLRAAIWNTLGHDLKLGRALTRFGMARFNETVDALAAEHRTSAEADSARLIAMACEALKPFAFAADHAPKINKKPHDFVLTSEFCAARESYAALRAQAPADKEHQNVPS